MLRQSYGNRGLNRLDIEIKNALFEKGVDIVRFVDISELPRKQTKGFTKAIVFGIALSKKFILDKYNDLPAEHDDFAEKEHKCDELSNWLAKYIKQKKYRVLQKIGFNGKTKSSRLPHKTIARLAGIGYIGKNNLLITEEYGCAFVIGIAITNAPVSTGKYDLLPSKCGDCDACKIICPTNAIYGNEWTQNGGRDKVIDVFKCECCLKCMIFCPHTLKYANKN